MAVIYLDSLNDNRLQAYAKLTEIQLRNKLEPEKGIFIAESEKVIYRALEGKYTPLSFLMDEKWYEKSHELLTYATNLGHNFDVFILPHDEISKLTGYELTRGVLAAFKRPADANLAEVLKDAQLVAVLENITNHTNVGAIFRSAAALGVDAILVSPACYDPLYRRAIRVSMGTVFQVPWARIGSGFTNWAQTGIMQLKELGFTTAALALCDDSISLENPILKKAEKLAVILGTEGEGLDAKTIAQCDYTVKIPMAYGVDSLNVAAASAVTFWELRR